MSDEISNERAEEMAARFERMEPTGTPEITTLGALYHAILDFCNHNPDGYNEALMAVHVVFYEDHGAPQ